MFKVHALSTGLLNSILWNKRINENVITVKYINGEAWANAVVGLGGEVGLIHITSTNEAECIAIIRAFCANHELIPVIAFLDTAPLSQSQVIHILRNNVAGILLPQGNEGRERLSHIIDSAITLTFSEWLVSTIPSDFRLASRIYLTTCIRSASDPLSTEQIAFRACLPMKRISRSLALDGLPGPRELRIATRHLMAMRLLVEQDRPLRSIVHALKFTDSKGLIRSFHHTGYRQFLLSRSSDLFVQAIEAFIRRISGSWPLWGSGWGMESVRKLSSFAVVHGLVNLYFGLT